MWLKNVAEKKGRLRTRPRRIGGGTGRSTGFDLVYQTENLRAAGHATIAAIWALAAAGARRGWAAIWARPFSVRARRPGAALRGLVATMERDVVMVGNVPTERLRWGPRQAATDGVVRTFVLIPGNAAGRLGTAVVTHADACSMCAVPWRAEHAGNPGAADFYIPFLSALHEHCDGNIEFIAGMIYLKHTHIR